MIERAQTVADVAAAFGGTRTVTGWRFTGPSEGYQIDQAANGEWVVGYLERDQYRVDRTFTSERAAARYLFAWLQRDR